MARHRDEASGFARAVAAGAPLEALLRAWCDYVPDMLPVARALEAALVTGDEGGSAWRDRMARAARDLRARAARRTTSRPAGRSTRPRTGCGRASSPRPTPTWWASGAGRTPSTRSARSRRCLAELSRSSPAPRRPGLNIGRQFASGAIRTCSSAGPSSASVSASASCDLVAVADRAHGPAERAGEQLPVGARAEVDRACGGRPRTGPAAGGPCPSEALSSSRTLTGSASSTAVASSCTFIRNEPSPDTQTTVASGRGGLGAERGRQAEAHRAEPAARDPAPRRVEAQPARRPHLVLADVGGDDRVAEHGVERVERGFARRTARAARPASRGCAPTTRRAPAPRACANARQSAARASFASPTIGTCAGHVLADLGRVDVDVHDLRVRRELVERAGHAVVEAGADGDDQVGLVHRPVRDAGAVHAEHPEPGGIGRRERAERHQRRGHRRAGQRGELAQLGGGVGLRSTPPPA